MGKNNQEVENIRLREEVKQLKKANKSLEKKLATANSKKQELQKRTKKKESLVGVVDKVIVVDSCMYVLDKFKTG